MKVYTNEEIDANIENASKPEEKSRVRIAEALLAIAKSLHEFQTSYEEVYNIAKGDEDDDDDED